jgi:hypothetical protein
MPTIQFLTLDSQFHAIPHPYPASRAIPDWFKNMPTEVTHQNQTGSTLKRCPPFLEAMTAGYIIPLPFDVELTVSPAGVVTPRCQYPIVSAHFPAQYAGSPFAHTAVLKFHNPWVIVTPPGYASLITAPINRLGAPILPLTGLVETDTYYREVHFPSLVTHPPGQRALMKRGTPQAQVIPIKTDSWTATAGTLDPQKRSEAEQPFTQDPHHYKQAFWKKLEYTWEDPRRGE